MLKVKVGTKDQYTDQITINLEREIIKDLSLSATYIWKRTGNIFVNWPLNEVTQEPFEYERVEYTTQYGETVNLYSIVMKDYNGDGVINGADVGWIGSHLDLWSRTCQRLMGSNPAVSTKVCSLWLTNDTPTGGRCWLQLCSPGQMVLP